MCSVLQADLIPEQPEADSGAGAGAATAAAVAQAVKLLNDQEGRGIAADVGDALVASAQHHSGLQDAVLRYFRRMAEASPDIESFTSLLYVCVKLRRIDEAFAQFEAMVNKGVPADARAYVHLIKGCGRVRQLRRGDELVRVLQRRNADHINDPLVFNARINMHSHVTRRAGVLEPSDAARAWAVFEEMQRAGVAPSERTYNSLISMCAKVLADVLPSVLAHTPTLTCSLACLLAYLYPTRHLLTHLLTSFCAHLRTCHADARA